MFRKKIDNYHKALKLIEKMIRDHNWALDYYIELQQDVDVAMEDRSIAEKIRHHKGQIMVLEGLLEKLVMNIGP